MRSAEEIASWMATGGEIQLVQTRYRRRLVEQWGIPEGARVLEIACGQGDLTAVLADAVGPSGHITAVDIAGPAYGAPVTLGESTTHFLAGPLGDRIEFRLGTDLLDDTVSFPDEAFDYVALAHGAWYFLNLDQLRQTLVRASRWAPRLRFAEWSLEPASFEQLGHWLAVVIQGQTELYKPTSEANVRTPFSRARFLEMLESTPWNVTGTAAIDTSELQDGDWEIDYCLLHTPGDLTLPGITGKTRAFIASQLDTLRSIAGTPNRRPLSAYTISARRE